MYICKHTTSNNKICFFKLAFFLMLLAVSFMTFTSSAFSYSCLDLDCKENMTCLCVFKGLE